MPDALPSLTAECFFIAPIGSEGSPERVRSDGILQFIVDRAAQELGLTAVRADQIADPGQITLQVIDHILGARAAVADVTGLNPNVFYELAVRHTAQLPVVIIAERNCELPFDIAQMRTIFFESTNLQSADQCRAHIVTQLRRALDGSVDSPITASVDVRALAGGSAAERNIAEIITTIEDIAKAQRDMMRSIGRLDSRSAQDASSEFIFIPAVSDLLTMWVPLREAARRIGDDELDQIIRHLRRSLMFLAQKAKLQFPEEISSLFESIESRPNEDTSTN